MKKMMAKVYAFIRTVPDQLYPFTCEIEGTFVRGRASYEHAVAAAWEMYGPHHLGYKLTLYREAFHFLGAVIFITLTALLSQQFLNSERALYVLLGSAILALFAQEFYYHPKYYAQPTIKGVSDWLTWVVPMVLYIVLFR